MKEPNWMEILDMYMDMVEKQDEIIQRMGKIISRQAEALQLIKNDSEFSDPQLEDELAGIKQAKDDYENMKP